MLPWNLPFSVTSKRDAMLPVEHAAKSSGSSGAVSLAELLSQLTPM